MSERLALQVSLQRLFDNEPALQEVLLIDRDVPGFTGTVYEPLDDLDSILTASLVVNF